MFPVSLAVCVSNEAAMRKAVSETNGSVQDTEADMRGDASVAATWNHTKACNRLAGPLCQCHVLHRLGVKRTRSAVKLAIINMQHLVSR